MGESNGVASRGSIAKPRDVRTGICDRRSLKILLLLGWSLCLADVADGFLIIHGTRHHASAPAMQVGYSQSGHENFSLAASRSIAAFSAGDFAMATGDWPYEPSDLLRLDNSDDRAFYVEPRMVTHIDDRAIAALTEYYSEVFRDLGGKSLDVLDLCSSWISHLPDGVSYGRVAGIGMNKQELATNKQLTEFEALDLNDNPTLPYEDNSFDVICNVVSVDYLTKPREVFQEMHRVLRPNGVAVMSFSNRCFPTKAVGMWLQADDIGRMTIVASYFHYAAPFRDIEAFDILPPKQTTPERPPIAEIFSNPGKGWAWMNTAAAVQKSNLGDPMYVVKATK